MNDLTVTQHNDVLVVDSRLIALELGVEHQSLMKTINDHQFHVEQGFGILRFETAKLEGRGRPNRFAYLTEDQATFVMTLSRNSEKVVQCKLKLVKAFSAAKQALQALPATQPAAPHDELSALRLELELSQSRERSLQLLASLDPWLVSAAFGRSAAPSPKAPIAPQPQPQVQVQVEPTPPKPRADVSSTWAFIDECLVPGDIRGDRQPVTVGWLYDCYKAYCVGIGMRPIGPNNWKSELKTVLPFNVVRRRFVGGENIPTECVWIDVRFGLFCVDGGAVRCIAARLGDGGVASFQRWAQQYGALYPYDRRTLGDDLDAMESEPVDVGFDD